MERWLSRKCTVWIRCTLYELLDGSQNRRLFLNLLDGLNIKVGFIPRDYQFNYGTHLKVDLRFNKKMNLANEYAYEKK